MVSVSHSNINLQYPNEVGESMFHTTVLAKCIMDKFELPVEDNIDKYQWLSDQIADFGKSMHEIGGKFAINEIQKTYTISPK